MTTLHAPRLPLRLESLPRLALEDGASWEGVEVDATTGGADGDAANSVADDVELTESTFRSVRFTGSSLRRLTVRDCRFERCELSGVVFEEAVLTRVELVDCRMSGAVFAAARLRHVRFAGCRLDTVNLRMATATPAAFHDCQMQGADLYGADLTGAELLDCDLQGAEASQATLTRARLHGSDLADVTGADALRGAEIDTGQVTAIALALLGGLGIRVTER